MKLLERHIAVSVLSAIALVTFILFGLQVFILFIRELGDIGREGFGLWEATYFVLLKTPYEVYQFFPVVSLLGVLIGLGVLASQSELVVMRASGMSIFQIAMAVFKSALMVVFILMLLGETVIPRMAYYANNRKMEALSAGQTFRTAQGVWLRSRNNFIFIGQINPDGSLEQVIQFRFNKAHELHYARRIQRVIYRNAQWIAEGIEETRFSGVKTESLHVKEEVWDVTMRPEILKLSSAEPDEMSLFELHQYLVEKKRNHQTAVKYEVVYYKRLLQAFSTAVMMMLGIPFIFGPLRASTMGSKLLTGTAVGFSFYILSQVLSLAGQIYQLPPMLIVPLPLLFFASLGIYLIRRVR